MKPKSIIFDLDGTLSDSGEGIMNCAEMALKHYGISVPDRDMLRAFVGPPIHETFIRFGVPREEADNVVKIYRSRYIPIGLYENTPYEGIREMLAKLKAQGHKLYVATSKPEGISIEILQHFGMAEYFTIICGASMDASRSTKADVIAYLLEQCGAQDNAVMVGDTEYDVIGAKAHGIPTISVSWGYGKLEDIKKAGPAAIVHTVDELYEALQK